MIPDPLVRSVSRRRFIGGAAGAVAAVSAVRFLPAMAQSAVAASPVLEDLVAATESFLASLSAEESAAVLFDWSNEEQKTRWSNFPAALYPRDGLMWGNLSEDVRAAWLPVMQATLSAEGYTRVMAEWNGDEALRTMAEEGTEGADTGTGGESGAPTGNMPSGDMAAGTPGAGGPGGNGEAPGGNGTQAGSSGGGPGGASDYGSDNFYIAIIGTPSVDTPWQWQFTGHHVTINATISNGNIALTPSFLGAQPTTYTDADGNEIRPIGDMNDAAFALINAMDADQQAQAVLGDSFIDLVLGPGRDGETIEPEGIAVADLSGEQQELVTALVSHYTGLLHDDLAAARLAEVTETYADTYIAWYGPTQEGSASYWRVAGPRIVVEYSPQNQLTSDPTHHIHAIYRDPANDYGVAYQSA